MEQRIRKGGLQTPRGFLFELTGGDVSLDFANTVDMRPTPQAKDLIPAYDNFLSWGRQTGLLTPGQETLLRKVAKESPGKAENARKKAVEVRECLFQIFSHVSDGKAVPEEIMNQWNSIVPQSMAHYELRPNHEGMSWRLRADNLQLDALLWPVVHSAVTLLTGPNASRIRKCGGSNCNWVFLDTSKRGNRRWCDMTVCGNRAKARAFYSRKKQQSV